MVEPLPSKCKVMSSNPSIVKKKKKGERNEFSVQGGKPTFNT
jgi:hypothetical protein